ncbi:DUF397 domain-containing protein [Streptomyces sp. NPDC002328]|uniref:DUF397 domain-containing protein n=1 Tax=Streptomyces sp. NPDC002328 TaxID=3364642 RepID=UPI00367C975C
MSAKSSADPSSELKWFKSSHSTDDGPACVEVAFASSTIHIRDSKNQRGPQLAVGATQWAAFLSYAAGR